MSRNTECQCILCSNRVSLNVSKRVPLLGRLNFLPKVCVCLAHYKDNFLHGLKFKFIVYGESVTSSH